MFVKSLTLRGFKSFASATTFRLEPGITCIVGPNGSGKSNVVDALAWVMGEQGARTLRGGKMEDVVFAGTHGRAPLGRAEVSMTIDNTDGALPIDYTEVTLTRTMFRNGGSEYAINGTACRLLDVQELLSDSGIGREMHVIVGQGQLDQVLRATPEERRGFIEEAAGVLKHRKRKERALRKLATMEANLTRLADLTTEIGRQLGPLGRQASTARRAATIQADVRDARLRILADDLTTATTALHDDVATEAALLQQRDESERALAQVNEQVAIAERASSAAAPQAHRAQETYYATAALLERLRATQQVAEERVRLMRQEARDAEETATSGQDPERLHRTAEVVRAEWEDLRGREADADSAVEVAQAERITAERDYATAEARAASLIQAVADRREGLARLSGRVDAQRSRVESAQAELGRLRAAESQAAERHTAAQHEYAALEVSIADVEHGERDLDRAYETLRARQQQLSAELAEHEKSAAAARSRAAALQARCEALDMSLRRKDGTAALIDAPDQREGVLGTVSSLISVTSGHEAHIAAALAWVGEAVVMSSHHSAAGALQWLREQDQGRAGMLVVDSQTPSGTESRDADYLGTYPAGNHGDAPIVWAADVVQAKNQAVGAAIRAQLAGTVLVETAEQAQDLVATANGPHAHCLVVVTAPGDVYTSSSVRGGSAETASSIEVESALEAARAELHHTQAQAEQAGFEAARLHQEVDACSAEQERALRELHDSDARMAAVAERLAQLGASMRGAQGEAERSQAAIQAAQQAADQADAELRLLQDRLDDARSRDEGGQSNDQDDLAEAVSYREELSARAARARTAETEARLTLRTVQERLAALETRAGALADAAKEATSARERATQRAHARHRDVVTAAAVGRACEYLADHVAYLGQEADRERSVLAQAQQERELALSQARDTARELSDQVRDLTSAVHRDDVARAEQRLRIEALQTRALEEFGVHADTVMAEFGPHTLVPVLPVEAQVRPAASAGTDAAVTDTGASSPKDHGAPSDPQLSDAPAGVPFVREEQDRRLRSAERKLAALGRVNPLALEEFAALEERHAHLNGQIEDLRQSKVDLLGIVDEVDQRVQRVFAQAFADTAAQFAVVFERLFPGGEGRLVLSDPDDLLTSGIEVEARPPGKRIKRLSLLSGGERSLTAMALLVSIFKARPSPFYIMDEVEAALDDTNLGRLITLFEELRDSSQLIVITHQKRTMEVADALYGVSMHGDGVTTVISQRLSDSQAQPA